MSERLSIGHGNGHNKTTLVDFVRQADADSFGCAEAQKLVDRLHRIRGHRVTGPGEDLAEARNRGRSTAIVTRSERENLGELTRKVSEHVNGNSKFGPDRWLVASMYRHPVATRLGYEGVAHFALHPDATVRNRDRDHPLVREYVESLDSTRRFMQNARDDGMLLVLTGDLQVPERFGRDFGPRVQIVRPLELKSDSVGIDWIIYDRALKLAKPLRQRKLYDHYGFVGTLVANGKTANGEKKHKKQ